MLLPNLLVIITNLEEGEITAIRLKRMNKVYIDEWPVGSLNVCQGW